MVGNFPTETSRNESKGKVPLDCNPTNQTSQVGKKSKGSESSETSFRNPLKQRGPFLRGNNLYYPNIRVALRQHDIV